MTLSHWGAGAKTAALCGGVGVNPCSACPSGTYASTGGMDVCTPCGWGKYYDGTGATDATFCQDCPDGTVAVPGSHSCTNLPNCTNDDLLYAPFLSCNTVSLCATLLPVCDMPKSILFACHLVCVIFYNNSTIARFLAHAVQIVRNAGEQIHSCKARHVHNTDPRSQVWRNGQECYRAVPPHHIHVAGHHPRPAILKI